MNSTMTAYKEMERQILASTGQQDKLVARFHTDDGTEFKGEFDEMIQKKRAKHTHTGGYNSISNPAENALARVQQCARAMLIEATGGGGILQGP